MQPHVLLPPPPQTKACVDEQLLLIKQLNRRQACVHVCADEAERLLAAGQCAAAAVQLLRAIHLKHLPSRALMAWLFLEGREGVARDTSRARQLAQEGARRGCHHCKGVLAFCNWYREPIVQDHETLELARESSEKGSRYGQYVHGLLTDAEPPIRLAADQNLDAAQIWLGDTLYENGIGPHQLRAEALQWYQLAAAQGNARALLKVGYMHELGHSFPVDVAEAVRWYKRAAAAGSVRAAWCVKKLDT